MNDDWELLMPFVICTSQGGPFDDESFVAGYQLGRLDLELAMMATLGFSSVSRMVDARTLPQIDLIAMQHDYRIRHVGYEHDGGWVDIDLDRINPEPGPEEFEP